LSARIILICLLVSAFPLAPSVAPPDPKLCSSGWCLIFPVGAVRGSPPFGSSAWNKLVYVPDDGRSFIYTSDGIYTFSNSWWSYGVLQHPATINPWIEESTSGTVQSTVTDNSKGFLDSAITPTDKTIRLREGEGKTFHPDPSHGGILTIDNEEVAYEVANRSRDVFTNVSRGARGTTPAAHNAGSIVTAGAPFPQSRLGGKLVAVSDHIPDRHPFLGAAYDSRRHQLFQAGGIVENSKLTDTWYFCFITNAFCANSDLRVWKRLITPRAIPARADSAMTYDPDDDVMILYGGQNVGNPTADTWLLCFRADPQESGNSLGCPAGGEYPDWIRVSTKGSPGPRFAHGLIYDSHHRVAVLFGGTNARPIDPHDVWIYSPGNRTWTDAKPDGATPASFRRPALAYDSTRGHVVLYEGPPETIMGRNNGGLFVYDAGKNRWLQFNIPGGPIPSNSIAHGRLSLEYDPKNDVFIATELGPGFSLQVWELKGVGFDEAKALPSSQ
jgi:hypothetical protein